MVSVCGWATVVVALLAVNTFVDAVRVGERDAESQNKTLARDNVNLKIFWIRHGFSCANVLKTQDERRKMNPWTKVAVKSILRPFYGDPGLTDFAIQEAQRYGPAIRQELSRESGHLPPVFSSCLRRAQETALANFPAAEVYPIPFIAEEGDSRDNIPNAVEDQRKRMDKYAFVDMSKIKYTDVNPEGAEGREAADYEGFRQFFPRMLDKLWHDGKLGMRIRNGLDQTKAAEVIIVSHSHFMQSIGCGPQGGSPLNNEVWELNYLWDPVAKTLNEIGNCQHKDLGGITIEGVPQVICPADVKRCRWLPRWLMAQNEAQCRAEGKWYDSYSSSDVVALVKKPFMK